MNYEIICFMVGLILGFLLRCTMLQKENCGWFDLKNLTIHFNTRDFDHKRYLRFRIKDGEPIDEDLLAEREKNLHNNSNK